MRTAFDLGPRLAVCGRFAAGAGTLCDVGTDHGYLPVALVQAGGGTLQVRGGSVTLTLAPAFRQELLDYCREQCLAAGPVFVSSRGRTINRSNLCRSMQELCRDASVDEAKGNPRALRSLYQATQADIQARMDLLLRQAYDQLLQTEQTTAGWEAGA